MSFAETIDIIGKSVDAAGVVATVIGGLFATIVFLNRLRGHVAFEEAYRLYRHGLGRAILLGLEILIAGDIIRTVAVSPTFRSVGVLAVIVLVRTFLSMALDVELNGRWPWQRHADSGIAT